MKRTLFNSLLVAFIAFGAQAQEAKPAEAKPAEATPIPTPAPKSKVKVTIETNKGAIDLELDAEKAPISVANFVAYAKSGFYEGTIFHRCIPGFMIQGGGMTEDMSPKKGGKPPIQNESKNGLKNALGTIAMARTNDPQSATSQFFINVKDNTSLDYPSFDGWGYAVFGAVTKGMDVVEAIVKAPTTSKGYNKDVPVETVTITKVTVAE
jgi:cyclophilin family peptidyl-prolyl cis-trans isomerase